jgi:hypothetical protein
MSKAHLTPGDLAGLASADLAISVFDEPTRCAAASLKPHGVLLDTIAGI